MAVDTEFEERGRRWTEPRRNRKRRDRNLSVLHAEIEADSHENLRRMAAAAGIPVGEAIDLLIRSKVRRLQAKGATGYVAGAGAVAAEEGG